MRALLATLAAMAVFNPAVLHAACKQELAIYSEPETSASLEFRPAGAATSHDFKLAFAENGVVLDGIVMWTEGVARPQGMLMHNCPDGDVTGEELAACTVWQGVIYAVNEQGHIDLLPPEGADAAAQLLLPDLAASLRHSSAYGMSGLSKMPWDAFRLSGCQE